MRLLPSTLVAAALAFSAAAVNIELFKTNTTCQVDVGGHFVCSDIKDLTCCRDETFETYHSARCEGLSSTDLVRAQLQFGGKTNAPKCVLGGDPRPNEFPPEGTCGPICNTASGPIAHCLDPAICWVGFGAYWINVPPEASVDETPAVCKQTVAPDLVVFANGQSFRINHDVPAEITAQLTELVKSDPGLTNGVPAEVAPFAVKTEKVA